MKPPEYDNKFILYNSSISDGACHPAPLLLFKHITHIRKVSRIWDNRNIGYFAGKEVAYNHSLKEGGTAFSARRHRWARRQTRHRPDKTPFTAQV
jgi:hypothetical protein